MAPHSSALAWKIPWMEEPGGLQSMGSWRVRHDWATSLSLFTFLHWRRKRQPTPVFLPGESQGRGSLVGCSPWGREESDTTSLSLSLSLSCLQTQSLTWMKLRPPIIISRRLPCGHRSKTLSFEESVGWGGWCDSSHWHWFLEITVSPLHTDRFCSESVF